MNEHFVQKCRTCLKNNTKTFPLTKHVRGCSPKKTYGQLLIEYAKFELTADYERHMPQYICFLCCRQLRNTYAFIRQAQYCNIKLVNVIAKKLDCLQEQAIDLPQNEFDKSPHIKMENGVDDNSENRNKQTSISDEILIKTEDAVSSKVVLKAEVSDEINSVDNADVYSEIIHNASNDLAMESSTLCTNETDENLIYFMETHKFQNTTLHCPICSKIINRRDNLTAHMRTQHDIEAPIDILHKEKIKDKEQTYACEKCPCKYTTKYKYINHVRDKHGVNQTTTMIATDNVEKPKPDNKIIKCRSCDYTARTYSALNYHNRSKHGTEDDKFKCKFCPYMCLKKFDLLTHVKNVHKELIKTLKAAENKIEESEISNNDIDLNSTIPQLTPIHKDENLLGDNDVFSSDDNIPLSQKFIQCHSTSTLNAEIDQDREEFSDEEFIRNILNIKKRQPKVLSTKSLARRCDECGNIYKNYHALYAHQRNVHISEDKYSLCPHCGKKYKRKTDLRNHIEKAHAPKNETLIVKQHAPKVREKRFMCTECSYVCTTITILKIHMNRHHTGEKPYKCDICFKSFIVPYDLKIHRYLHTGERPYKCPICSKGFRDNSHMIKHKRIHSNERPYKCKDCGKSFTQSYNLSVHKRTHLKEKKLNCLICGKLFENKSLLNIHRINENHHDEIL